MLAIYHSNQLSVLKAIMLQLISFEQKNSIFSNDTILVQSLGMGQWLKQQMALANDIATLMDCQLPAQFIWNSYQKILKNLPEDNPFRKESMTWHLLDLLPSCLDKPEFASLKQYLTQDKVGRKRYQLAEKIADVFDQYLVYRSNWIFDWENGGGLGAHQYPWQPQLWRDLLKSVGSDQHRAKLQKLAIESLSNSLEMNLQLPENLYVFGISALPEQTLEFFSALSEKINIHLLIHNPCQEFWSDIRDQRYLSRFGREQGYLEVGNPLLASFGKLGRDYLAMLESLGQNHLAEMGEIKGFVASEPSSILSYIQNDILTLTDRSKATNEDSLAKKLPIELIDRSIVLHDCHSPTREIEVLQDYLLDLFVKDKNLTPKDIIVMTPDVELYTAAIEAVFLSAPKERFIPFAICDRKIEEESPVIKGFMQLLNLPILRTTANELMELMEIEPLLQRFSIESEDFNLIGKWIKNLNICWSLDGNSKGFFDLPLQDRNSWNFGLQRLFAGYAVATETDLLKGIAPAALNAQEAVSAGKLAAFIERLSFWQNQLRQPTKAIEWVIRLQQLFEDFFQIEATEQRAMDSIYLICDNWSKQLKEQPIDSLLSVEVVRDSIQSQLDQAINGHRFLTGSVNFCTLMPMRSIPFKIVCLLGMNDGQYPRQSVQSEFDLLAYDSSKRGDRSRREDDRYLFLEAILAAQEKLFISYVGHSIYDNSPMNPSVLVTELTQYLQASFFLISDCGADEKTQEKQFVEFFTYRHALAAFDKKYFTHSDKYFSYAKEWCQLEAYRPKEKKPTILYDKPMSELDLTDLLNFWKNPIRFFFQKKLGIYLQKEDLGLQDQEPFSLNGLDKYQLKLRYLEGLGNQKAGDLSSRLLAEGGVPAGAFGSYALDEIEEEIEGFWLRIKPLLSNPKPPREINLPIGSVELIGWLKHSYGLGFVQYQITQKSTAKQLQNLWLHHLCKAMMGESQTSYLCNLGEQNQFKPLCPKEAEKLFSPWIDYYQKGLLEPLCYLPESAWAWLSSPAEKTQKNFDSQLKGGFAKTGEIDCPYVQRFLLDESLPSFNQQLQKIASELLEPMQEQLATSIVEQT